MRRLLLLMMLSVCSCASTHYVSSSNPAASDSGTGTTAGAPWKTLSYAMGHVVAGDSVLLNRGDVWNEPLVISQNNLTIDAYPVGGTGPAPRITGYQALSGWSTTGGNIYKATMSGTTACSLSSGNVYFNSVPGQLVTASSGAGSPAHDRDFYCDGASPSAVYVYAPSSPSTYYGPVFVVTPSNSALLDTNGKTGLSVQHLALDYFDNYGVYVHGGSTNLTFANMSVNGMVVGENRLSPSTPGYKPYGFYVSNAGYATSVAIYNVDADLNFDGFRFDGYAAGSAITMVGCRGFANRDAALYDNSGSATSAVTYSSSHFYASGIGSIGSTDVVAASGLPVDGGGNVAKDTAPVIQGLNRFPALFSYTVDDVLMSGSGSTSDPYWAPTYPSTENYIDLLTPVFNAHGIKMNMAAVAGFAATGQYSFTASQLANWLTQGHEIESHSWSHEYYTGIGDATSSNNLFSLQYVGSGTAATMTITGYPNSVLATTVTGASGQNLSLNLSASPYDTVAGLKNYFATNWVGVYAFAAKTIRTGVPSGPVAPTHTVVADDVVSPVDIKTSAYVVTHGSSANNWTRFWTDEVKASQNWLKNSSGIAGLTSVPVMVYPGGWNTASSDGLLAAYGYVGGRGEIGMHPAGHTNASGCSQSCTPKYASDQMFSGRGVDGLNIISLSPAPWHGQTRAQIDAEIGALVFKAKAWGLPIGLFSHNVDLMTPTEIGWFLEGILSRGGQVRKNSELVSYVETAVTTGVGSGVYVDGTTNYAQYVQPAIGPYPSMRTAAFSPDAKAEAYVSATYGLDILGNSRGTGNWDIGAYQSALWGTTHGAAGTGKSTTYGHNLNGVGAGENAYCLPGDVPNFGPADGPASMPTACTYTGMAGTPSPGTTWTVSASNCNDVSAGLQAYLNSSAAGDTIVIPASVTCSGSYTLPAKTGANATHWTTIRTDQISNPSFPAEGARATPCEINVTHIDSYPDYSCANPGVRMPTLIANAVNTTVINATGASYYRLIGLNITKPVGIQESSALVTLDSSDHVILDRVLIHGVDYSSATKLDTHIGISTRGTHEAIINSWCYDVDWNAPDGQCIAGGTGTQTDEGPLKIYNNLLAGASETWIFGGGAAVVVPHDFEIRNNLSMKPLKWMIAQGATSYNVSVNVKNLGEWKQGDRVLMENNVFMNDWEGQSDQYGSAILMMPKSQSLQDASKYANTSGTSVSCASDATGTPCAEGTGIWGNKIVSLARAGGIVTLTGASNGTSTNGWPYYNAGSNIVLQGIPSQVMNGVDMASFNGEWTMGCLNASTCTSGYSTPRILYFPAPGPDFPTTTVLGGIAQDLTSQTCGVAGHCVFDAPKVNYPTNPIVAVIDTEHITVQNAYATQSGATQVTCHSGITPNAELFDFIARYNFLSHAENIGFIVGNVISQCQDVGKGVARVSIHDNIADDVDTTAWNRATSSCCGHGGQGPGLTNSIAKPALFPHDILFAHNSWVGMRGWPSPIAYFSENGFGYTDSFNVPYTAATILRVNNVVTITFSVKSGASQGQIGIVSGFTGSYVDLNGSWPLQFATTTQITFIEPGSHADISPAVTVSAGTTGAGMVTYPVTYYKNVAWRDNIFPGPLAASDFSGHLLSGGLVAGLALNFCDPNTSACTWQLKNNLIGTALYANYPQGSGAPYPTTNPDSSAVCTVSGGCTVADFSNVFTNWGASGNGGMGSTAGNDYHVTAAYKNGGSDGKDLGADMSKLSPILAGVPQFTYYPLTVATTSLAACTNGTYCEQQLLTSSSATTPTANGFVRWKLTGGTLPTGMNLSNGEGYSSCQVNGSYSKTGATGCQGWLWGTPTQGGSFPVTFKVEDGAHQVQQVALTLVVN